MTIFATQRDTVEELFNTNWTETKILYDFTDMIPDGDEYIHLQIAPVIAQNTTINCDGQRTESLVRITCYADTIYRAAELMDMVNTLMIGSGLLMMSDTSADSGSMKANQFFYSIGYNIYDY